MRIFGMFTDYLYTYALQVLLYGLRCGGIEFGYENLLL